LPAKRALKAWLNTLGLREDDAGPDLRLGGGARGVEAASGSDRLHARF
jgi:hypothetical protein